MIRFKPFRRPFGTRHLDHIDGALLREIGLNPDDFRDAAEGRSRSVLFTPFRDLGRR